MTKMTLAANAAHELSCTAKKHLYKEAHTEAMRLVEGYVSRAIKEACDRGAFSVEFKFPKENKSIWNCVRIILCNNEYKASIKQNEPILIVKW